MRRIRNAERLIRSLQKGQAVIQTSKLSLVPDEESLKIARQWTTGSSLMINVWSELLSENIATQERERTRMTLGIHLNGDYLRFDSSEYDIQDGYTSLNNFVLVKKT